MYMYTYFKSSKLLNVSAEKEVIQSVQVLHQLYTLLTNTNYLNHIHSACHKSPKFSHYFGRLGDGVFALFYFILSR